jgi:hypothetical protein
MAGVRHARDRGIESTFLYTEEQKMGELYLKRHEQDFFLQKREGFAKEYGTEDGLERHTQDSHIQSSQQKKEG